MEVSPGSHLESYLANNQEDAEVFCIGCDQLDHEDANIRALGVQNVSAVCARAGIAPPVVGALKLGDGKLLERVGKFLQSDLGKTLLSLFLGAIAKPA